MTFLIKIKVSFPFEHFMQFMFGQIRPKVIKEHNLFDIYSNLHNLFILLFSFGFCSFHFKEFASRRYLLYFFFVKTISFAMAM